RVVCSAREEPVAPSLFRVGYGTLIGIVLAVPLGIASARWRNRLPDHLTRLLKLVPFAMPPFCVGLILVRKFILDLGWFPVSGYGTGFLGHVYHLTLPALTIGLFLASILTRSLRARAIALSPT